MNRAVRALMVSPVALNIGTENGNANA